MGILYFTYIAIAWYDHWYQCKRNLGPTYLAVFYWWAKPKDSEQIVKYKNWCSEIKNKVYTIDLMILALGVLALPKFLAWKP